MTSRSFKRPPAGASRKAALPTQPLDLTIDQMGARGDGLAQHQGQNVYIPFTVPGDRVIARLTGRRGDGLTATLQQIVQPSDARAEAPCPHYQACGGCTTQHVTDSCYDDWKWGLLAHPLLRMGFSRDLIHPMIRVPTGTRRRAAFAFMRRKGRCILGFHGRSSHDLVDLDSCLLLQPAVSALLPALRLALTDVVPAGEDGHVTVTLGPNGLDVLVDAVAHLDLVDRERLAVFAEQTDLARLSWRVPDSPSLDPIARRRPAEIVFGGLAVEPPPGGFLQPTEAGEQAITRLVLAAVAGERRVADLYCGCGSFTVPLAAAGHQVYGAEGEDAAIRSLQAASNRHSLNIKTEIRDLARRPLLPHELKAFDAVVFDPPRAGAAEQAIHLAAAGPQVVVAVSCNPATLARDLQVLVQGGYRLDSVTPIDQFPYAAHLEAVAVLKRAPQSSVSPSSRSKKSQA